MQQDHDFLRQAIELAYQNCEQGGRPFGAVLVKDGQVIASGVNEILKSNDPTAHAELLAIRAASQQLGTANLQGYAVFASGQPCPMCMAGINRVTYAHSNDDAEAYGLSTAEIYADLAKPFAEQSMTIRYIPVRIEAKPDLYGYWTSIS
ncbi:tRNA-specific adenosine deaminase [Acinetobacter proteolyticus]|uniref:nucleoside deaminase n=1 Tax=Acinetobacter proteolyticus TaxID=1776741 RepID=UPI00086337B0|nr:nucleoside deaminase [Acinetobacter proteolyticus]OEY95468.1 tRNA-specific adenosine deaminase [Acinetobacter proteolyticus]